MMPRETPSETTPLVPSEHGGDENAWRVAASCVGFMADAYDLFTIDMVIAILHVEYGETVFTPADKSLAVCMMLAGVILGQLCFGLAADHVGRKWAAVVTAALTIVGALASSLCKDTEGVFGLARQLALCRFLLGIGVGGEYPLSATVTAESCSDSHTRGRLLALVVSMQGFGMLLSSLLGVAALQFGASLEFTWRLLLAFGAVPSSVAFYMRWSMHETEAFQRCAKTEDSHMKKVADVLPRFWRLLVGTSSTWFLMNIFQYSIGSFKSSIMDEALTFEGNADTKEVLKLAVYSTIQSSFAVLGFVVGHALLIARVSRFAMQFYGFLSLTVVFAVTTGLYMGPSSPSATQLLVVLAAMFLCLNAGPNITTFLLPAEIYPTQVRATLHGFSAACGKLGALLGTAAFPLVEGAAGLCPVFAACTGICLAAVGLTFAFTPRQSKELSDLDQGLKIG